MVNSRLYIYIYLKFKFINFKIHVSVCKNHVKIGKKNKNKKKTKQNKTKQKQERTNRNLRINRRRLCFPFFNMFKSSNPLFRLIVHTDNPPLQIKKLQITCVSKPIETKITSMFHEIVHEQMLSCKG